MYYYPYHSTTTFTTFICVLLYAFKNSNASCRDTCGGPREAIIFHCPKDNAFSVNMCEEEVSEGCECTAFCQDIWSMVKTNCDNPCNNNYWTYTNGCGGFHDPITSTLLSNSRFNPACQLHDICYNTPGVAQWHCDYQFLENMFAICRARNKGVLCGAHAILYFWAAWGYGKTAYNTSQQWTKDEANECSEAIIIPKEVEDDLRRRVEPYIMEYKPPKSDPNPSGPSVIFLENELKNMRYNGLMIIFGLSVFIFVLCVFAVRNSWKLNKIDGLNEYSVVKMEETEDETVNV